MSIDTGWTPEYIEGHLTWPRFVELVESWEKFPPVRVLVASFLGYKPRPRITADGRGPVLTKDEILGIVSGRVEQAG